MPDPTNPQAFNRFSYVENTPINFNDPTGHCKNGRATRSGSCTPPLVTFDIVEGCSSTVGGGCSWSDAEKQTIQTSAMDTAIRLAQTLRAHNPNMRYSAHEAFLLVYGGYVSFLKTGQGCLDATGYPDCWGKTFLREGQHVIDVYTDGNLNSDTRWAVHELGHAFVNSVAGRATPVSLLEFGQTHGNLPDRPNTPNDEDGTWGFAGIRWGWQRSNQGRPSEEFADMYLGWVYNRWEPRPGGGGWSELGQKRADFMDYFMPLWISRQ